MIISILKNNTYNLWVDYSKRDDCIWVFDITETQILKLKKWCNASVRDGKLYIGNTHKYITLLKKEELERMSLQQLIDSNNNFESTWIKWEELWQLLIDKVYDWNNFAENKDIRIFLTGIFDLLDDNKKAKLLQNPRIVEILSKAQSTESILKKFKKDNKIIQLKVLEWNVPVFWDYNWMDVVSYFNITEEEELKILNWCRVEVVDKELNIIETDEYLQSVKKEKVYNMTIWEILESEETFWDTWIWWAELWEVLVKMFYWWNNFAELKEHRIFLEGLFSAQTDEVKAKMLQNPDIVKILDNSEKVKLILEKFKI